MTATEHDKQRRKKRLKRAALATAGVAGMAGAAYALRRKDGPPIRAHPPVGGIAVPVPRRVNVEKIAKAAKLVLPSGPPSRLALPSGPKKAAARLRKVGKAAKVATQINAKALRGGARQKANKARDEGKVAFEHERDPSKITTWHKKGQKGKPGAHKGPKQPRLFGGKNRAFSGGSTMTQNKFKGKSGFTLQRASDGTKRWMRTNRGAISSVARAGGVLAGGAALGYGMGKLGHAAAASTLARAGANPGQIAEALGNQIVKNGVAQGARMGALGAGGSLVLDGQRSKRAKGQQTSRALGAIAGSYKGTVTGGVKGAAIGGGLGVLAGLAGNKTAATRKAAALINGVGGAAIGGGLGMGAGQLGGLVGGWRESSRGNAALRRRGGQASLGVMPTEESKARSKATGDAFKQTVKDQLTHGAVGMAVLDHLRAKAKTAGTLDEFEHQRERARGTVMKGFGQGAGIGGIGGAIAGGIATKSIGGALGGGLLGAGVGSGVGTAKGYADVARYAKSRRKGAPRAYAASERTSFKDHAVNAAMNGGVLPAVVAEGLKRRAARKGMAGEYTRQRNKYVKNTVNHIKTGAAVGGGLGAMNGAMHAVRSGGSVPGAVGLAVGHGVVGALNGAATGHAVAQARALHTAYKARKNQQAGRAFAAGALPAPRGGVNRKALALGAAGVGAAAGAGAGLIALARKRKKDKKQGSMALPGIRGGMSGKQKALAAAGVGAAAGAGAGIAAIARKRRAAKGKN